METVHGIHLEVDYQITNYRVFFIVGHDQRDGHYNGADGYPNHMARWLNRKLQTDFGFTWTKFQYVANSQTHGQNGTCHSDCAVFGTNGIFLSCIIPISFGIQTGVVN